MISKRFLEIIADVWGLHIHSNFTLSNKTCSLHNFMFFCLVQNGSRISQSKVFGWWWVSSWCSSITEGMVTLCCHYFISFLLIIFWLFLPQKMITAFYCKWQMVPCCLFHLHSCWMYDSNIAGNFYCHKNNKKETKTRKCDNLVKGNLDT